MRNQLKTYEAKRAELIEQRQAANDDSQAVVIGEKLKTVDAAIARLVQKIDHAEKEQAEADAARAAAEAERMRKVEALAGLAKRAQRAAEKIDAAHEAYRRAMVEVHAIAGEVYQIAGKHAHHVVEGVAVRAWGRMVAAEHYRFTRAASEPLAAPTGERLAELAGLNKEV